MCRAAGTQSSALLGGTKPVAREQLLCFTFFSDLATVASAGEPVPDQTSRGLRLCMLAAPYSGRQPERLPTCSPVPQPSPIFPLALAQRLCLPPSSFPADSQLPCGQLAARSGFCIRLPRSRPVPTEGPQDVSPVPGPASRQTSHHASTRPPQTPAALLTSAGRGRGLAPLRGVPQRRQTLSASWSESPTQSMSRSTHLPANPAASLRPALWPSRAAHSHFIHRPSLPPAGVASPLPPMAARFGRGRTRGDSGRSAPGRSRTKGRDLGRVRDQTEGSHCPVLYLRRLLDTSKHH